MKVVLSKEVEQAKAVGQPVVALESSVICQGLPWPQNLTVAQACEAAIRRKGAIPATIAVLAGQIRVGLSEGELVSLARPFAELEKLGARELCMAVAKGQSGGTTVSATCEIAYRAGIHVFATGGIGGVHRGDLDVSQDLWALSRFPVAVVCAGAKSVLDLPRTLEALEALSVPVVGVGTDVFPAFFCQASNLRLSARVENAEEAAQVLRARQELTQGGMVLSLPPPVESSLDFARVEGWVAEALEEAQREGVKEKAVTPFLLRRLVEKSDGRTLESNVALLEHNSGYAAEVAAALQKIK